MTSRVPEDSVIEYLVIPYQEMSFLLERRYCHATLFDGPQFADDRWTDGSALTYGGQDLPLIHLDRWLARAFDLAADTAFPCVLVTPTSELAPETLAHWDEEDRPKYVGWAIAREPSLVKLPPAARGRFPEGLAPFLAACGLAGCRFPDEKSIAYYLDPEALVRGSLQGEPR